ncbi:16S rRNA (uracil(1498)-N(3))-methyltransferase [Arthrobacter pityocampae]|uniref:Ribosomal RNA small subunit methyltransferase E n=1 Tax=Arthrobacter pityocampae TaxID=547334 RepID=A0A2S5IZF1_9MICC|nr:16S rRNA (uracil(1498)-N(3))-methyltransferase [Arthrobacter pityocampae]PPB49911.1 16S rRNA (uracil(1498)-N(3))-methyltransferase [Arthrobacter pityocampae]
MTRPLFFGPGEAVRAASPGSVFVLGGDEGRHAATVRRLGEGERLDVSDGAGYRLGGVITAVGHGTVEVAVETAGQEPAPRHRLILVQALAKGGRDEQAVESATELGIDAVVPWHAERSIVRWRGEKAEKGRLKWASLVSAAAKQSRRSFVPEVHAVMDTPRLAAWAETVDRMIVLHEDADLPLADRVSALLADGSSGATSTAVVVGPEGGISAAELGKLRAAGADTARLGPYVLRSSTAGPAALALLNHLLGRW